MGNLIYNCDPGLDDAFAMIALSALNPHSLTTITTSYGNAAVSQTTQNAAAITRLLGTDSTFRIVSGCIAPAAVEEPPSAVEFNGPDGFCGLRPPADPDNGSHATRIPNLSSSMDELLASPTTVICTAPFTNVARMLQFRCASIERIIALGGYSRVKLIAVPRLSYNIRLDPASASSVLSAEVPCEFVGLDVYAGWTATDFAPVLDAIDREQGPVGWFMQRAVAAYRTRALEPAALFVDSLPLFAYFMPSMFRWVRGRVILNSSAWPHPECWQFIPDEGDTLVAAEIDMPRFIGVWAGIVASSQPGAELFPLICHGNGRYPSEKNPARAAPAAIMPAQFRETLQEGTQNGNR